MVNLFIDYREDKKMVQEIARLGLFYEKINLKVGDFVVNTFLDGKEESIGIERKTQSDFLNSISDKRILVQLNNLRSNYKVPLLIIEGDENLYSMRNFHPNAIRGMLVTISIDLQIPIIYTRNVKDTAKLIKNISDRLRKVRKPIALYDRKKPLTIEEQKLYVLESLPGVGPKLAKNLLDRFGSISEIINASEVDLKEVDKLGPKKSSKIREIFS